LILDFRALFESVPGLYLVLAKDFTILAASDAYLRATMTKREDILAHGIFEVFPDNPDDQAATGVRNLRASLERVLRGGIPDTMAVQKYDIRKPELSGGGFEERYWSPVNAPVLDSQGEVAYIIHRVEDVTDFVQLKRQETLQQYLSEELRAHEAKMQAELLSRASEVQEANRQLELMNHELSRSEERFRSMVAGVMDYAIFMLDCEGRISSWNAGAERIKGYQSGEIIGEDFSRFYPREDIAQGKPAHALKMAASEGQFEDEGWRVRKDGSRFWANVVITAVRNAAGELLGFSKVTRDFSDRKEIDEALRASESRFRSLFEFSPDAIIVSHKDGKIAEVNGQVQKSFGYGRSELLGKPVEMLIPERFRQTHPQHRQRYSSHAATRPMGIGLQLHGRRKDGTEFPVDIMLSPVEMGGEQVVLSVIRDLSEKQKAEEALRRSEQQKSYLEEELGSTRHFEQIVGENSGLKRILKQVEDVAPTDATVLILGETGTGKELIARALHDLSPRQNHTFVKLNCSAIPSGLLESELFGHEKGAFTGAIAQKIGRLELAHQGTFFLDEVGDLPLELQPKILRALQEKEFERVGGTRTIPVNVRLLAATNRDLAKMVAAGQFRSDLYYRLRVFPVTIPPLRERRDDIPLLVRYFLSSHSRRMGKHIETIPAETMRALTQWSWPGNVRELENFIERSVILSSGPVLRAPLAELDALAEPAAASGANLLTAEREHILRVLRECHGMIGGADGAAERLGLKRTTLNSKLKKLGIKRRDYI